MSLLLLLACSQPSPLSIPFQAHVDGTPFSCAQDYPGLGTASTTARFQDARVYLHAIEPLDADGEPLPFTLDDGDFQGQGVALLDFEDGSDACETGSPDTHTALTGTVTGDVAGLRFTLGVPSDLNHLDNATAGAPLDAPGMWWSWAGGYKYLKIDLTTATWPAWFFHLGATDCEGTPGSGFSCSWGNTSTISLPWTPGHTIALDLARLYDEVDLSAPAAEDDLTPGCMSFADDPSCPPLFRAVGLGFMDGAASPQTILSVGDTP